MDLSNIKVIAFDADDTLWDNELFFREAEDKFSAMLEEFLPIHSSQRELLTIEINNLDLYGYGIKAFMLSMIEAAIKITNGTISAASIDKIISIGKEMLDKPVTLLPDVEEVLLALSQKYRLVVATKGDLLDQERKLKKSNLGQYFHHIEIMSDKKEKDYQKLLKHLDVNADQFIMIGNSLKSDVLPVLNLGGIGIHIPYHTTWIHETVDINISNPKFIKLDSLKEVFTLFT
jgi:putative hydrolase of the HAD superfamily